MMLFKQNFYYFFFTHLAQEPSFTKWIDIIQQSITDYPANFGANNLMLRINDSIKSGNLNENLNTSEIIDSTELEVIVSKGEVGLNASHSITVDKQKTIDSTLQPVNNFSLLWKNSTFESSLKRAAEYVWIQQGLDFDYPKDISADGIEVRPSWLGIIDEPEYILQTEKEPVWTSITADSDRRVSSNFLIDAYSQTLNFKADKTDFFNDELIDISEYQPNESELPKEVLIIENFPKIFDTLYATYKENSIITSSTYKINNRGYIPSSSISMNMRASTLTEIAFSILSLISFKEDNLLYLLLSELTYIWAHHLKNVDPQTFQLTTDEEIVAGFPTVLTKVLQDEKDNCFYTSARSMRENAWLGFALVEAAKYFRNRPNNTIVELPPFYEDVLIQLGKLISFSIEESSGMCITFYDDYGFSSQAVSHETTCIASIFLTNLLTVQYDEFNHYKAAKAYLNINDIVDFSFQEGYELLSKNEKLSTEIAYLYWLYFFKKYEDLEQVFINISSYRNILEFPNKDLALTVLMFNTLKTQELLENDISGWYINIIYSHIAENVYGIDNVPDFISSSVANIILNNYTLSQSEYYLYADEAEAGVVYAKQTAIRLQPNGYHWQSQDSLESGELMKLFKSYSELTFANNLLMQELFNSVSISLSQGKILDAWANSFNYKRKYLQSDSYVKNILLTKINMNLCTKDGFDTLLRYIYGLSSYKLIEPTLPKPIFIYENQVYTEYNFATWEELLIKLQGTQVGKNIQTVYLLDWKNQLKPVPVSTLLGYLIIEVEEYVAGLIDDILKSVAGGIQSSLHFKLSRTIPTKTFTINVTK